MHVKDEEKRDYKEWIVDAEQVELVDQSNWPDEEG